MNLRVLHETSMVGQGYFDPLARAGVHRTIVGVMGELAEMPGITQGYGAFATAESALGLELALSDEPTLLPGIRVPTWRWRRGTRRCAQWVLQQWIRSLKQQPRWHPGRVTLAATYRALSASVRKPESLPGWDVVHSWYHPLPLVGNLPNAARILTVHDVIPLIHPEWFPEGSARYARKILDSLTPADWVVCSSHATLTELLRLRDHPVTRTMVIHLAADARFTPAARDDTAQVRRHHGLGDRPYLVALGTREPRKNLARLVSAYSAAFRNRRDAPLLAIVGSQGWDKELGDALDQARDVVDGIRLLGRVADEELPGLLAGALALAYPSLHEGFGIPPLEAMACGTPVITSNCSSLPEVVGHAALLVDPRDTTQIATALRRMSDEPGLRADLAARALVQAGRFSWRATATSYHALYARIAAKSLSMT